MQSKININKKEFQSEIANVALQCLSPDIVEVLLKQTDFTRRFGIEVMPSISFDEIGVAFKRSEFFDGIRSIYSGSDSIDIEDVSSKEWRLKLEDSTNKPTSERHILLKQKDGKEVLLTNYQLLSPNLEDRLDYFRKMTNENYFSQRFCDKWEKLINTRPLTDIEFNQYHLEFQNTPNFILDDIHKNIQGGELYPELLVPNSIEYFEQLIGKFDNSETISEFAKNGAKKHIDSLISWQSIEGLKCSLLLSLHSSMSAQITASHLNFSEIREMFESIKDCNNSLLKFGAIQLGLNHLKEHPKLAPIVIDLIEQLKNDEVGTKGSELRLLNVLYILVEGELAKTRCLSIFPPFYRRLASLVHASILQQFLSGPNTNLEKFKDWAFKARGEYYYFQTFSDFRFDPRWSPDFSTELVMKDYMITRILDKFGQNLNSKNVEIPPNLRALLSNKNKSGLIGKRTFPYTLFSSPLDGSEFCLNKVPIDVEKQLKSGIKNKKIDQNLTEKFFTWIIMLDNQRVQKFVVDFLIQNARFPFEGIKDKEKISHILSDMSIIAAITKSEELSVHVMSICQQYRKLDDIRLHVLSEFQCCLTSSCAFKSDEERRKFVGNWILELSFSKLDDNNVALRTVIHNLCHVEPEFWKYCSRAEAALSSCE